MLQALEQCKHPNPDADVAGAMQDELQEELAQELVSYNIDPMVEGLTDEQYTEAMAELGQRREALLGAKGPEEQRRIHAMRNNILWHLHTVSLLDLVCQALCPPWPCAVCLQVAVSQVLVRC